MPADVRDTAEMKDLSAWGCGTTMHLVRLHSPRLAGEGAAKDIDFTRSGIRARWQAGYDDARRMVEQSAWQMEVDPREGLVIHDMV